jgi:NCAIR mutase (PurE)-related protein
MESILKDLYERRITPEEAKELLESGYLDIQGIAKFDFMRQSRCGIPEIVISEGKEYQYLLDIAKVTLTKWGRVIISRCEEDRSQKLLDDLSKGIESFENDFDVFKYEKANGLVIRKKGYEVPTSGGIIGLITAGTSDIPVALEAKMLIAENGIEVLEAFDVGVAGLHRLVPVINDMSKKTVDVYIVCAGREGTLPSLVAGMVDAPVIGVPVSTGYGEGGAGKAALYSMLQSCAPLAVVNIDAGLVAGVVAVQISNKIRNIRSSGGDNSDEVEGNE